ncbi:TOMM system kinase/cyclase fusion protein [Zooshikella marina]|uniref:TOMM system kinase/cyclase fusion protein n=1 Tax=Zooshikella ganghwensis TaxID=202772 RepID=UPI001BAE5E3B|nr:TOMM system kinase/cyclase fusion protein [Zooshikella ganghwensis]MBU2704457.1 TOMM system kinase/cyclase fusion protein [Zooshikella ganghwensis]
MDLLESLLLSETVDFNSEKYKLITKIGEGGFGQVYKATQVNTGQLVAIKFLTLNPGFEIEKKKRYIERFERETFLSSRLQHPHIVRLIDKGCQGDELLYAVFEYVDGITLKMQLAESGPLLPAETALIMAQVLDALAHAHKRGVIHRDIKPANIMIAKEGAAIHAKLLDFGIGSLVSEARNLDYKTLTLTQEALGTPSYCAPEQLRGEPPTTQSDIYVWGLVFLECLTGQPAVSGSNLASIFHKQLSPSNIPLPSAVAGHSIATFLRRVLNKKVSERANKAEDLYQELNKINLATLVGDITDKIVPSSQAILAQPTEIYNTVNHTIDNTIVAKSQLFYTALTEVKQLTVLCITLTIKSVIESTLDAEILDTLHRDQKAQCVDIAIRFGAYHVGTLGDTLLFYFGYPKVSDNDCRLCARTALEISSNLSKSNALLKKSQGVEILPAMGMHTGAVTIYADTTPEGETPNIAMALSRMALPMQIICSESSKNQLERYIEFEKITAKLPVHHQRARTLFSLKGERAVEAFGFLRANHTNQSFIARCDELEKLIALLPSESLIPTTTSPELKIAHIYGEAGIGKSRLTFELRRKSKNCNHFITQCLPEHKHNALYPVFNLLKYQYSLSVLTPEEAVSHLRTEINKFSQLDEKQSIPIICSWLGLPLPSGIEQIIATPETQKHILFDTLKFLINRRENFSSKQCNLFVFEDIHWADPTTLEFIAFWLLKIHESRASSVFISTSREPLPEELSEIGFMVIELSKLDYKNTAEFIISRFDHQQVSAQVLDVVATRTDGIPLFIEEMVNMLKQKNLIHHLNGVVDFSSPDKVNQVPSSLRESLQQKLDSLVYAKETAQLAATIGREFDYKLLVLASIRSEEQIQTDLNELVEAGMIYLQRKIGDDSYIFKHALVRDAAYESMSKKVKISSHLIVAEILERLNSNSLKQVASLLHYHFSIGNNILKAAKYAKLSAEVNMEKSEYSQSMYFAKLAYDLYFKLNDAEQEQLVVNQLLVTSSMMVLGWGSVSVFNLIQKSIALLKENDDTKVDIVIEVYWALAIYYDAKGNHNEVNTIISNLLTRYALSISDGDKAALYCLQAHSFWCQGKLAGSLELTKKVLDLYDDKKHKKHALKYGHDTKVLALCLQMFIYTHYDTYKVAEQIYKKVKIYAKSLVSFHSLCMVEVYWVGCLYFQGKIKQSKLIVKEVMHYCEKYKLTNWVGQVQILNCLNTGDVRAADVALQNLISNGSEQIQGLLNSIIVESEIALKSYDSAYRRVNLAIEKTENYKEYLFLPFLLFQKGKVHYYLGSTESVVTTLREALSQANSIGIVSLAKDITQFINMITRKEI